MGTHDGKGFSAMEAVAALAQAQALAAQLDRPEHLVPLMPNLDSK